MIHEEGGLAARTTFMLTATRGDCQADWVDKHPRDEGLGPASRSTRWFQAGFQALDRRYRIATLDDAVTYVFGYT